MVLWDGGDYRKNFEKGSEDFKIIYRSEPADLSIAAFDRFINFITRLITKLYV